MKTTAHLKHRYTGQHWDFFTKKVGNSEVNDYFFNTNITFTMGTDRSGRITFYSEYELLPGSQIRNIYDINNKAILPDSKYDITSIEPTLNVFNQIVSYKYKAARSNI